MIRSSVRSAGLVILLTMNGCGSLVSSGSGDKSPGLNVAQAALEGGAGQIALQVSEGVLLDSPNNVRALEIKGDALGMLGENDEAAAIFKTLLLKDPNSIRANTGLGRIKLGNDPAGAEALFLAVLKREPTDQTALNNLGIARDLLGRHAEAQSAYRQALGINPDLDSAKVNMALSLSMSGQKAAAVEMLKAAAAQPGATVRIKHDYAVVLAKAGHRAEAEAVLSENLAPDQVRQVLDGATGTHTRVARDEQVAGLRPGRWEDDVPPDVVQVPEISTQTTPPPGRLARVSAPVPIASPIASPVAVATVNPPPPMVVRPRRDVDPDPDAPVMQPVSPAAAAMTYQRPLSLPLRANDPLTQTEPVAPREDTSMIAMPPVRQVLRTVPLPVHDAPADTTVLPTAHVASPPLYQPVPAAFPLTAPVTTPAAPPPIAAPMAFTPVPAPLTAPMAAAHVALPVPAATAARVEERSAQKTALAPPRVTPERTSARASAAPEPVMRLASRERDDGFQTAQTRNIPHDSTAPAVQFAAATSEEAAHAFWQNLVRRFPDALSQRAPTVIRFEHGGTVFWRVRTEGFNTAADALSLCARMRAGGQDCFVPRS
jgi:Flp pilus assembly protein TadD